jgi:NADH-quinone oxidoreductase subunit G
MQLRETKDRMAVVHVNDKPVDIGGERLNLVQAALKANVFIPHYCWHPSLSVVASCRMCLVEVGEMKDGKPVMQPKVVPACQTPAKDGTVVITNSKKAVYAQQQTLESLLLNHPLDCPVCDKAGECLLQDYSYRFGRSESRLIDDKNQPPNKPDLGKHIGLFTDRCIMCSRCVRFTREVSGTAELQVVNRGNHSEIDVFPGEPLDNKLSGNVVDLCPVGALASKDFLYTQRVWFLKTEDSVCADCSTGCSIHVDHNKDIVYRLRPRENPLAQGYFMCDEGRYGFHYVHAPERLRQPFAREGGSLQPRTYDEVLPELKAAFAERARSGVVAALISPFLTCEEAYLLATYIGWLSRKSRLALGPVPEFGADDVYPKDRQGRPVGPAKFTIRAEKCPNRRGVEQVLRHFQKDVESAATFVASARAGRYSAIWIAGGYPPDKGHWILRQHAAAFREVPLLVVQDLFASPLSALASYVLPSAAFAEKEGTFINHANLAQALRPAIRPPREVRTEGQVYLDLLNRPGLVHAPTIRAQMAREIPFFAKLLEADLGRLGLPMVPSET